MGTGSIYVDLCERIERAVDYFRKSIGRIVDDLTLPAGPSADDCPEEFSVDEIMKLRGALWYALQMGDIDKGFYRLFTDQLNSLYEMATNCQPGRDE